MFYLLLLGRGGGWLACFIFSRVTPWGGYLLGFYSGICDIGHIQGKGVGVYTCKTGSRKTVL